MQESKGINLSEGLTLKISRKTGNLCFLLLTRMVTSSTQLCSPKTSLSPGFSSWGRGVYSKPCVCRQTHVREWVFPCEMWWLESCYRTGKGAFASVTAASSHDCFLGSLMSCMQGLWDAAGSNTGNALSTRLPLTLPLGRLCQLDVPLRRVGDCIWREPVVLFSVEALLEGWFCGVFFLAKKTSLSLWILAWQLCSKSWSLL